MDEFRTISTVLSMILGLGVTRLLLGMVNVFRIRRQCAIDWLPLAWAGVVFATQLQFWWAINHLPPMQRFGFSQFVFFVLLTLMLFLSAALILPNRAEDEADGMQRYFERDGRYGLLSLAGFLALGVITNLVFFGAAPLASWSLLDIPMIALPIAVFLSRSRRLQAAITAVYLPLLCLDLWVSL